MTNQQRLAVGLALVLAVIGGGLVAWAVIGGGDTGGASPSPVAATSPSTAPASASVAPSPGESPNQAPSPSAIESPSAAPTPTPPPTPTPTVAPGRPTTVVLTQLKLDAADDPSGLDRRIAFRAQGSGAVSVAVRTLSPQGSTLACLAIEGERDCTTTANGSLTAETATRRADVVVTLRGEGIEAPIVEVAISFPARNLTISIANARFDGTGFPETNGLQVLVTPREDGDVGLEAAWGGHPFGYEVDLLEQGGPGAHVLADQEPATGATVTLPVTTGNPWKLVLQNIDEGFGVTQLDATVSWP